METPSTFISLSQLWKNTLKLYKQRASNFASLGLVLVALMLLTASFSALRAFLDPMSVLDLLLWGVVMILKVTTVVFSLLYPAALILEAIAPEHHVGHSHDVVVRQRYLEAGNKLGSYLFILLLVVLVVTGAMFVFILPGIFLQFMLMFSTLILFAEGKKGFRALASSWGYVRGHWWSIFGKMLVLVIFACLSVLVVRAIAMPFDYLLRDSGMLSLFAVNTIQYLVVAPFSVIYSYEMYRSLKAHKHVDPTPAEMSRLKGNLVAVFVIGISIAIVAFAAAINYLR